MVVFDRDRDDGPFTPREPHGPPAGPPSVTPSTPGGPQLGASNASNSGEAISSDEWDPLYNMFVTPNPHGHEKLKNPVSHWRVSKKKITGTHEIPIFEINGLHVYQIFRSHPMCDL